MMLKRVMGKASFATIQDTTGRIQLYVTRDLINSEIPMAIGANTLTAVAVLVLFLIVTIRVIELGASNLD